MQWHDRKRLAVWSLVCLQLEEWTRVPSGKACECPQDTKGHSLSLWHLAGQSHGPELPCTPASCPQASAMKACGETGVLREVGPGGQMVQTGQQQANKSLRQAHQSLPTGHRVMEHRAALRVSPASTHLLKTQGLHPARWPKASCSMAW